MIEVQASVWEAELPAAAASVPEVRGAVTEFAQRHGAPDDAVSDIALAVTEAVTNAILHAFVDLPPGTIYASAHAGEATIVVTVTDDGRGMTPRADSPGLGLGLPMIGQLTSSCDIREGSDGRGTRVQMTFAAPGVTGPGLDDEGRARLRLLGDVGSLADSGGWPAEGIDQLIDLLVPAVADAGVIDLIDERGDPGRIAARVNGDGPDAALSRWLAARRPRQDQIEAAIEALRVDGWHLIEMGSREDVADLAHDDEDAASMAAIGTAWWLVLPLGAGDQLLGSLGLGFRRERGNPREHEEFLRALADRVARGLANTQLVAELRRMRARLERILDALAEAVTVTDEQGRVLYANQAAVELLGAATVDEVLSAQPAELRERFELTRADGTPVDPEDIPGRRVIAGRTAEPLLTRTVERASGRVRWLRTRARRLDDESPLSVNIIEDVTDLHAG